MQFFNLSSITYSALRKTIPGNRINIVFFVSVIDYPKHSILTSLVPELSCGTVCVILHLAISVERFSRLVTDRHTWRQKIPALASIARVKTPQMCACHCAQLSYTIQHRTVLLIFPLILTDVKQSSKIRIKHLNWILIRFPTLRYSFVNNILPNAVHLWSCLRGQQCTHVKSRQYCYNVLQFVECN